mmetsp:Transcript_40098/g.99156  ORF Transcript_40098/g.99156 Transcript_40098/m.99156 type:complete len:237 (-) Transcript_40098:952-1662(-)
MGDPTSLRLFSDALSDLEQSLGSVGGLRERPEKAWSRRAAGRDKRSVSSASISEPRQPVRQLKPGEPEAMAAEYAVLKAWLVDARLDDVLFDLLVELGVEDPNDVLDLKVGTNAAAAVDKLLDNGCARRRWAKLCAELRANAAAPALAAVLTAPADAAPSSADAGAKEAVGAGEAPAPSRLRAPGQTSIPPGVAGPPKATRDLAGHIRRSSSTPPPPLLSHSNRSSCRRTAPRRTS